jgi:hypothetical protein
MAGVENMMWSTDFPHHGSDWPYARKTVEELFSGVPAAHRRKIVATTACAGIDSIRSLKPRACFCSLSLSRDSRFSQLGQQPRSV